MTGMVRRVSSGHMTRYSNRAAAVALPLLLMLAACGSGDGSGVTEGTTTTAAPSTSGTSSAPVGVIAIGHSALTGENSDPSRPGQTALENSWATGSNPEVNSVYRRLVAVHPDTEGHVANRAQGGAQASSLAAQAAAALEEVPTPELVIIETIDSDIRCDGTDDTHVPEFGRSVAEALALIAAASPASHLLLVGQPGRPPPGIGSQCGTLGLTATIESYEAEQARMCAAAPLCSTDDGTLTAFVPEPGLTSPDGNHNSIAGHARLAELIWPVVERQLGL